MSLLTILAKGFSGLGIVSTVPLSFAFHKKTIVFKTRERSAPPEIVKPAHQPSQPMDQMAEIVKQELGNQEVMVGCFETQGSQKPLWTQSLYVCINLSSDLPVAFWFHYNWKSHSSQRVNQVTNITNKGIGLLTLNFSKGSLDIRDRLRTWAGSSFNPSQSCQITKNRDSYILKCGSGSKPFSQTIKSSDFHRPKTLSLNS